MMCYYLPTMKHRNSGLDGKLGNRNESSPRVFLYVRVSTDRQTQEGHSLGDQEARLRGYAQSLGLPVTAAFIEGGVSAAKRLHTRPKGGELLATVRPGDHIIATKLDRMFRSAQDALNVAADLRDKGVHLHLLDIGGEVTGNGAAKLVFTILSAVAEMERERIGERVRSVKQHLREGGYFTGGKLARGYHVTDDGKIGQDAQWQRCLGTMKQLRDERVPYRRIAERVNEDFGIRMDYSTAYRILNGKRELDSVADQPTAAVAPVAPTRRSKKNPPFTTDRSRAARKRFKTIPENDDTEKMP
jgi:putative DNA-invertase from lambdoid prophage Rac